MSDTKSIFLILIKQLVLIKKKLRLYRQQLSDVI